jgi:2,3-bisphosphoglycerate-independent phosphoglycerate mutase
MAKAPITPVVLVILDGWGYREDPDGNAIRSARTPNMDALWKTYPHTTLAASGLEVGLPRGQMGNSEVGHLNIGAGRVVKQELVRISSAIEDGSIFANPALLKVCEDVKSRGSKLHLLGLCSEGGVHSHTEHLGGLLTLAAREGIADVCIHAITDGRDTMPKEAIAAIAGVEAKCDEVGVGRIVTVSGRYYAMDRDRRWDRIEKAYRTMTDRGEGSGISAKAAIEAAYANGITDEFIEPTRIAAGSIDPGDGVIFFNFRPDRSRQLTQAFVDANFREFDRTIVSPLTFATLTQYDSQLNTLVAFAPEVLQNILGEVIADRGLQQFRTAETEKYAHVTYFFNGGIEPPLPGETRELVYSPQVSTYDEKPTMSAEGVTTAVLKAVKQGVYSLIVANYANPDMVGHTGKMEPTIAAIEEVDRCLGELIKGFMATGATMLITADHGNAEYMWDENGEPWTAHTTSRVPFILIEDERHAIAGHGTNIELRAEGKLADIAPTILDILGIDRPIEMTGESLIPRSNVEYNHNRTPIGIRL